MTDNSISIEPRDLLTAIHNNLNQRFYAEEKSAAKRLFRAIAHGTKVPFISISNPEAGEVKSYLALDRSEFNGRLNFRIFRAALAAHLHRIAAVIESDESMNIFSDKQTGNFIYHLPGVIEIDGIANVLVTGVEDFKPGGMTIKLQFLDAAQFTSANPEPQ